MKASTSLRSRQKWRPPMSREELGSGMLERAFDGFSIASRIQGTYTFERLYQSVSPTEIRYAFCNVAFLLLGVLEGPFPLRGGSVVTRRAWIHAPEPPWATGVALRTASVRGDFPTVCRWRRAAVRVPVGRQTRRRGVQVQESR